MNASDESRSEGQSSSTSGDGRPRSGVRSVVVSNALGQRLDNFLARECRGVPRSRVYRMIRRGEVRINGSRARPSRRLSLGDVVRIPPVSSESDINWQPSQELKEKARECIAYREAGLLVVDKPPGWAVHRGSGLRFGLIDLLQELDGGMECSLVHRLDRDTSGCLLVATDPSMVRTLGAWFRERKVVKRYDALVCGRWPHGIDRLSIPLRKLHIGVREHRVVGGESGDEAVTLAKICRSSERITWMHFRTETGRTHQIRVHAQTIGHPVVGDPKYGDDARLPKPPRMMLHAKSVRLPDGREYEVRAGSEFRDYWNKVVTKPESLDQL